MKYYPPVLVVLRLAAVVIILFYLYRLFDTWLTLSPGVGAVRSDIGSLVRFQRDQTMMKSLITAVAGAVLYGVAPYLARLIVLGAETNRSEDANR
ncbi:hypothetical protein [Puniceicoccus vermicola]|uniref:Uncharacterized protein n=1 Tax=Puniceicoccus vermicola TaxID=388746 RepID=A0A7X1AWY4_9BACT|nr:hypothetical protein [Puniceicoccus vermicola]MBC2601409.1 hypothetical protein [Puniceicoccus vermicola]